MLKTVKAFAEGNTEICEFFGKTIADDVIAET